MSRIIYMVNLITDRHLAAVKGLPQNVAAQREEEIEKMPDPPRVVDL